jgi:hypothetical protein
MAEYIEVSEARFQELDARLQASEHTLANLSTSMTEVVQTLRQLVSPTPQSQIPSVTVNSDALRLVPLQNSTASLLTPSTYYNAGSHPHPTTDMLSRWNWVDAATVQAIVNGTFDISNLPKLFRQYSDRHAHTVSTTDGLHLPADGTQPYVVTAKTRMLTAFPSLSKFLSAWSVYSSIRSAHKSEYAPALF